MRDGTPDPIAMKTNPRTSPVRIHDHSRQLLATAVLTNLSSVTALTHVNLAFAFVDPDTYAIVPMDDRMPTSLFADTTNLKLINPGLKIFISVGG